MTTAMTHRATAAGGVLVSADGIGFQIAGGVDYPTVPPALLIALVAILLTLLAPWRWAPVTSVLVGVGTVGGGLAVSAWVDRLGGSGGASAVAGTWVQMIGGAVALVAGAVALAIGYGVRRRVTA